MVMTTSLVVVLSVGAALFLAIIGLFMYTLTFKHTLLLKKKQGNSENVITVVHKCRVLLDKSGAEIGWRMLRGLRKIATPPHQARTITEKGRTLCIGWEMADGQIQWEENRTSPEAVQFFTSNQRALLINQLDQSDKERGKSLLGRILDVALPLGFGLMITILVICGMIFFENVAQPVLAIQDKELASYTVQKEILVQIQDLKNDVQRIGTAVGVVNTTGVPD